MGLIPVWWGKPLKEFKVATFNARAGSRAHFDLVQRSITIGAR